MLNPPEVREEVVAALDESIVPIKQEIVSAPPLRIDDGEDENLLLDGRSVRNGSPPDTRADLLVVDCDSDFARGSVSLSSPWDVSATCQC